MADLALALATPVTTVVKAAPAISAKASPTSGATDLFTTLMAAASPAAPTPPAAALPVAANADEATSSDIAEKTGEESGTSDESDGTGDSDALLALLILAPTAQPVIPVVVPVAAATPASVSIQISAPDTVLPNPTALPAAVLQSTAAPVIAPTVSDDQPAAPATQPSIQAIVQIAVAQTDAVPLLPQELAQATAAPVPSAAIVAVRPPIVQAGSGLPETTTSAPMIGPTVSDDQPATPATQPSIQALVQMAAAQTDVVPPAQQEPAQAAAAQPPVVQIGADSPKPNITDPAAALAADPAAIGVKPTSRTVRMIVPKLDRAAPATARVAAGAEASAAKAEPLEARPQEVDLRQTRDHADDHATPVPQQQIAPVPTHDASTINKTADIGSTDAVITRHLDLAQGDQWLDGLAKDIAATGGNSGSLSFTLSPENLGALKVDITQAADGASVHITTDTDAARNIILDAQPKLAAEARAQGLTLKETSVSTNSDQQRQPQSQSSAQSSAQQQSSGQDRRAFAQAPAQPLSPTQPIVADEESGDELYA